MGDGVVVWTLSTNIDCSVSHFFEAICEPSTRHQLLITFDQATDVHTYINAGSRS